MDTQPNEFFSDLEIDTLQEIMNIAFGHAAADLAEVINIFVELTSPNVKVKKAVDVPDYIKSEIKDFDRCSIVEQSYMGESEGIAFLIFPYGAERELISFFHDNGTDFLESDDIDVLEQEILMEVGNILIGACVGKIFELLKGMVTYLPPRSIIGENFQSVFLQGKLNPQDYAILMKTNFNFEDRAVSGFLFLINSQGSIESLKHALAEFWKQYQ